MRNENIVKISLLIMALIMTFSAISSAKEETAGYWKTIYVDSVRGSKNGSGTQKSPYATIEDAKEAVKKISSNMKGDIFVDIAEGEYYVDDTIIFNASDSGRNGHKIVWGSTSADKPVISGGKIVDGWKLADAEKNLYVASCDEKYIRQIYVNGVRAIRARSKEYDIITENNSVLTNSGYITANHEMLNWKNIEDVEFVYTKSWTNPRCLAHSVTDNGDSVTVEMDSAMWRRISVNRGQNGTNVTYPWYIENALELLDEEGEFYFDRKGKLIYYMPRKDEDMTTARVIVPHTERLFEVFGTPDEPVTGLDFNNIAFKYTALYTVDKYHGFDDTQNNFISGESNVWLNPAVWVENSFDLNFFNCEFSHLGGMGLVVNRGVHDSDVIGCHFYDIAAGAVAHGTCDGDLRYNGDLRLDVYRCDIKNNFVHDVAYDYRDAAAVSLGYVSDVNLVHNDIGEVPYSGITACWGWDGALTLGTGYRNVHIDKNYIYNTMHETPIRDGAAIYTLGCTGGSLDNLNTVNENYIRQSMRTAAAGGLYTDEGSSYYQLKNNVVDFYDAKSWWSNEKLIYLNVWTITDSFIHAEENFVAGCDYKTMRGAESYEKDTVFSQGCVWSDKALEIIANSGLEAEYRKILGGGKTEGFEKLILDRNIALKIGERRTLEYSAQNTYGKTVSKDDYNVSFASETPEILTVDGNTITAVKQGIGKLRFDVTYGNKVQTRIIDVMCGDELKNVMFKDDTKKLLLDAQIKTELECTTALGKYVEEYDVVYISSDPKIASVSPNGVITALSEGECEITATVTYLDKSVSASRIILCETLKKFDASGIKVTDISDAFNDTSNWTIIGGHANSSKKNTITIETPQGNGAYAGKIYNNELLNFNATITSPDTGWPTICFSIKDAGGNPIANTDCYLVTIKPDSIELQRFNNGARTMFYGVYGTTNGVYGIMSNDHIKYGSEYNIQIGAITQADGNVRLIMNVDGYNIFDCIDYLDGKITDGGYFGCINRDGAFVFTRPNTSVTAAREENDGFEDIRYSWAKNDIEKLRKKGIITGVSKTQFMPDKNISRAEFITLITRVLGTGGSNNQSLFDDVASDVWYFDSIMAALNFGIIDTHFVDNNCIYPETAIRRDEIAALLVAAYEYLFDDFPKIGDVSQFADYESIQPWSAAYIKAAVGCGLMNGDDTGTLRPQGLATRAEAAALLNRFVAMIE